MSLLSWSSAVIPGDPSAPPPPPPPLAPPHWDLTHSLQAALILHRHGGLGGIQSQELSQMIDNKAICNVTGATAFY